MLGSSRGGFDLDAILATCLERGVNQIYIIGGDGTHRAADRIQQECRKRKIKMTVAGVPKVSATARKQKRCTPYDSVSSVTVGADVSSAVYV